MSRIKRGMSSMNKVPVVIPYISTKDKGIELRYALRSLKNIKNFNGEVYIIGDKEKWFANITHIPVIRRYGMPYFDQVLKMKLACELENMPEQFIASMDDLYVTKPTEIKLYHMGPMEITKSSPYHRTKQYTLDKLLEVGLYPYDYELHVPMLVNRDRLLEALNIILADPKNKVLQWRSMYANMFNLGGEQIEDKKTKTLQLKDGPMISTNVYTAELNELFPEPSRYEAC